MQLKMAKTAIKSALYSTFVLTCVISTVAFAQFRILCEIGDASEFAGQGSSTASRPYDHSVHSHGNSAHTHSKEQPIHSDHEQGAVVVEGSSGHTHVHGHDHSQSHDSKAAPIDVTAHEGTPSTPPDDEACCKSTGFIEFNTAKAMSQLAPHFVTALISYVVSIIDPVEFTRDSRSFLLTKLNAPPPLSLHIPTTILRI